jgi:hypothetical protein
MKSLRLFRLAYLAAQRLARLLVFKLAQQVQLERRVQLAPPAPLVQQVQLVRKAIPDRLVRKAQLVIPAQPGQLGLPDLRGLLEQLDPQVLQGQQVLRANKVILVRRARLVQLVRQALPALQELKAFKVSQVLQAPVALAFNIKAL